MDAESESGRCTLGCGPPSSQRWQRENCNLEVKGKRYSVEHHTLPTAHPLSIISNFGRAVLQLFANCS